MYKNRLRVINGTNQKTKEIKREFISAYVTNTRLMGVIGMYIHWKLDEKDYYQLFHFDAEEYGFDNYISINGDDRKKLTFEKEAMMGGLGGKYVRLKEIEARYLLQRFIYMNIKNNLPLPESRTEYAFLDKKRIDLTEKEKKRMMEKICVDITTEYQAINYFLMRLFSMDEEGVIYLTRNKRLELYDGKKPATLLRNIIEENKTDKGVTYVCESLIEENLKYRIKVSEIEVGKDKKNRIYIKDAKNRSTLNVSATEAAFMLNRPEYINIYSLKDISSFVNLLKQKKPQALYNLHTSIHLFTEFNLSNKHVKEKKYMLNGDIYGIYCITETGQLIISAYMPEKINKMEKYFSSSEFNDYITLIEKLEFKESVLYEFVHSGYDDFFEFLSDF